MNIYFISGLGADRRAFEKIILPENHVRFYLDWLEPLKQETLHTYALRMAQPILKEQPFVLIGLSFGGIIAIEISKYYPAKKIILISSISNYSELPWYYKLAGKLYLQKSLLIVLLKHKSFLLHWFFGTKSSKLQAYLNEMIDHTSLTYLKWSLDQIVQWKQMIKPENVFHIHGTADKLFPVRFCKPDKIILHGGHFMVITHGKELSAYINEIIA